MPKNILQENDNLLNEDQELVVEQEIDFTFSELLKEDICTNEYSSLDYKVILYSFFRNNLTIRMSNESIFWQLRTQSNLIIDFILNALETFNNINIDFEVIVEPDNLNKNKNNYILNIKKGIERLEKILNIYDSNKNEEFKKERFSKNILIGAFLSGGSISNPSKNYHLEIRSDSKTYSNILKHAFERLGIEYKTISRHSKEIFYFKKSEIISNIIAYLGANRTLFAFEEIKIRKDLNQQIIRLNNVDFHNIEKSSKSGSEIKRMIEVISKKHRSFREQNQTFLVYCEVRKNNPELSLQQIADIMFNEHKIKITKAGLNHINQKIKKMFSEI